MASEQQPLLRDEDSRSVSSKLSSNSNSWRSRCEEILENKRFHLTVLILIAIDACCVLADLSYTFLNDSCSPEEENEPYWLTVLAYLSLGITSVFLFEIPVAIYTFGPSFYNPFNRRAIHSGLHFLDATVIVVTFVVEVFLRGRERELASLLIFVRMWRLIKLAGGVAVGVGETSEPDAKRLQQLETLLISKDERITILERDNGVLETRLRSYTSSNA